MDEPMTLKYQPSTPHSTTFSSFFSDDSLLLVTPEKPISSISNQNILEKVKLKEQNDNILSMHFNNSTKIYEPGNDANILNENNFINTNRSSEYFFRNLERSKHQDILERESKLDIEAISKIENLKESNFNDIDEKKLNIENKSDEISDILINNDASQICRESKVNFHQAVSVHCFSPEDSNLSQCSDSTNNDSPILIQASENNNLKSSSSVLPSFNNIDRLSKSVGPDSNINLKGKSHQDFILHEPYIDNLTEAFDINKYTSTYPNGFYDSYRGNIIGFNFYNNDLESPTNISYNKTSSIDSLNNDSSFNNSPIVIPAIDLSYLSLTSSESTDIYNKQNKFNADVNIDNTINNDKNSCLSSDKAYILASSNDTMKSNSNENNNSKEACSLDKKIREYLIEENNRNINPLENKYKQNSSIKSNNNYKENFSLDISKMSNNYEKNEENFDIIDDCKLKCDTNILSQMNSTKRSNIKTKSKITPNTKHVFSDKTASNKNDKLDDNILSEAKLNSLLTLTKKVEALKEKKFDEKIHINANQKAKIHEKALCKLNHPSSVSTFNDLPTLDVNKTELIVKKNKLVLPNRQPVYLEKVQNESNIKMPELLDFYSDSLFPQPSKSYSNVLPNFLPIPRCQSSLANLDQGNEIYEKFVKYSNNKL